MFKLSIITINRNNADGLRKTIESVVSQNFTDFEYIVIDGASTDESVEVIKEYADKITYWVSEPDKGIYNAMNKGILQSKGEYCLFLNSGDCLAGNIILNSIFRNAHQEDILSGYVNTFVNDGWINIYPPKGFSFRFLYFKNIPHQAEFIKRRLFTEIGMYNEQLQILSDYEFNIKAMLGNYTYKYIPSLISIVDGNGLSNSCNSSKLLVLERNEIFKLNIPQRIWEDYLYYLDKKKISHPSIDWIISKQYLFKGLKFIYKYFGR